METSDPPPRLAPAPDCGSPVAMLVQVASRGDEATQDHGLGLQKLQRR